MSDRKKVIKGMRQHVEGSMFDRCGECPYYEFGKGGFSCRDELLYDALTLLKDHAKDNNVTSKWVSVKDRLPNDGQDVLAYMYNGEETRIAPFNYDKGTWYDCVMNCTVAINSITHWMPLPEPPKEVSE